MVALLLACLLTAAPPAELLVYHPFESSATPAWATGADAMVAGPLSYAPGRQGQAVRLKADLRLPVAGNLNPTEGTFAVWVAFDEPGSFAAPHYLWCVYGGGQDGWRHNRFSLYASGGLMTFSVWDDEQQQRAITAPIAGWSAGSWHHVAATWSGLDGTGQGRLRLYLDGQQAAQADGLAFKLSQVGEFLDIGRDSDGSPDYTDGLLDELYVLSTVASAEEIRAAAMRPANQPGLPAPNAQVVAAPGWHLPDRPWRVAVALPAADQPRADACFDLPLDFATGAGRIQGASAQLDPGSVQVTDAMGKVLPWSLSGRGLAFQWPGTIAANQATQAFVYFALRRYDLSVPLQARSVGRGSAAPGGFELPDYATVTYGDAWDFDEGDDEGIDQWGNAPELIQHEVADGQLKLKVKQDPWFIWGNMWSQVGQTQRPVAIDVDRWRRLEIRVRQSVPSAEWTLYARPAGKSGESLIHYDLNVSGTGWQTVRVDLVTDAHFGGELAAFRIDPTNDRDAEVDIDWIRLLAVEPATALSIETVGEPSSKPTKVALTLPNQAMAGERLPISVAVLDAAGQPVAGQPVRLQLAAASDAELAPVAGHPGHLIDGRLTALTDTEGKVTASYRASTRIAAESDRVSCTLPFAGLTEQSAAVTLVPGDAAKVVFRPARPVILARGETTAKLTAQVADSYGNAVAAAGVALLLSVGDGATVSPVRGASAADGSLALTVAIDPAKRWVAKVQATAGAMTGLSPAVCITPDRREPGVVMTPAGQFTLGGQPWLPLGGFYANWVGDVPADGEAGKRNTSFVDTDDAAKLAWMQHLAADGVNSLRFMLRAHRPGGMEPMDIGGRVNPELYAEALRYLDLARPLGIRFLLVVHEDYTKPMYFNATNRELFCLPRWQGEDLDALPPFQRRFVRDGRLLTSIDQKYTDPDAMACQDQYARELVNLFKDNPQVLGFELENEMVAVPPAWIQHACGVIRSVDSITPILMSHGGGGLKTADPQFWRTKSPVEFYTYHIYPQGTTSENVGYGRVTDVLTAYGRMSGRSFLGESVGDEWGHGAPVDMRKRVARDVIWYSLVNGNPGCMFWNHRGDETAEFRLARRWADQLQLAAWQPAKAEVAVLVPHPLDDDRYYRSKEGDADLAMMYRYAEHYRQRGMVFDFAWRPDGYRAIADLKAFAPPAAPAPVVPTAGYEAASLLRAGTQQGLCYVRNAAGVAKWDGAPESNFRIWFRTVKAAPARITLQLGPADKQLNLRWVDLVTGQETTRRVAANATVELGAGDHDYAVTWTE